MAALGDAAARVSPSDALLIIGAGMGAGMINAVVGAGTLITFPTLLLLGYPPVLANVSNTIGLVPGQVMATIGYRATLVGKGPLILRLVLAAGSGGLIGGGLLVLLPARAFESVVAWLLLIAAFLAAAQPRISAAVVRRRAAALAPGADGAAPAPVPAGVIALVGLTGVYGGYFGAAQGVILLVVLGLAVGGPLNDLNGVKNILSGTANLVSALLFLIVADIDWRVAGLVAVGSTIGGGIGGRYGRRMSSTALRTLLVLVALLAAAVRLVG